MVRSAKKHAESGQDNATPESQPAEIMPPSEPMPAPVPPKSIGQQLDDAVGAFTTQRQVTGEALTGLKTKLVEIQGQITTHEQTLANIDRDQAAAVKAILSNNSIRLEPVVPFAAKSNGKKLSKTEMAAAIDAVANALSGSIHKSRSTLAEETGLDLRTVVRALSKLHREGKAESNGIRGANGGWIRK